MHHAYSLSEIAERRVVKKSSNIEPALLSGRRPSGVGKAQSAKASSIVLMLFLLRNHDGTESEDELLGNAYLLGVDVNDMKRRHCKVLLPANCRNMER